MSHRWCKTASKEKSADESFPVQLLSPKIDEVNGVFWGVLDCAKSCFLDFSSSTGKALYRMCVKVFNENCLVTWGSVLGLSDMVKPDYRE